MPLQRLLGTLEYAKRRKKALLLMLMVEMGLVSLEHSGVTPEDFAERAVHRFSEAYGAALRLIHARHSGGASTRAGGDLAFLESRQAPNGSWEQQSLLTLVAMMPLGPTKRMRAATHRSSIARSTTSNPCISRMAATPPTSVRRNPNPR